MHQEVHQMSAEPQIQTRAEQPYVAIRTRVAMSGLAGVGARLGEVFDFLGKGGVLPVGPPFFKYNVIDMAAELEVEGGVPVAEPVEGDGQIISGVIPAGRYATVSHVGHPDELFDVTSSLLDWATRQGLRWDMTPGEGGEHWAGRLEFYLTDPSQEPDMNKWETQLAFKLAD
jgi:effector-binding domain-containing protein